MNYPRITPYPLKFFSLSPLTTNDDVLDYSHSELPTLVENSLSEPEGVGSSTPLGLHTIIGPFPFISVINTGEPHDWNIDFDENDIGVTRDINRIDHPLYSPCPVQNDMETLDGFNDWNNLRYDFQNSGQFADGIHNFLPDPEISVQVLLSIKNAVNNLNATKDSFLTQGSAKNNEGANPILRILSSDKNRPVIAFDQNKIEIASAGETLQSATLRIYIVDNGNNWGPNGRNIGTHKILDDWDEGNGWNVGNNISGTGSGVTWNCAIDNDISNNQDDCAAQWDGGNIDAIPTSTVLITNDMINQFIEFDITSDVQAFLDGTTSNFGWMVKKDDESQNGTIEFASKESNSNAPKLLLVFEGQ